MGRRNKGLEAEMDVGMLWKAGGMMRRSGVRRCQLRLIPLPPHQNHASTRSETAKASHSSWHIPDADPMIPVKASASQHPASSHYHSVELGVKAARGDPRVSQAGNRVCGSELGSMWIMLFVLDSLNGLRDPK